jgi:hypothetical protein
MADPIVTTHPDKDGVTVTESRLRKQKSSVTTSETITGGLWKKVQYVEPDTGLVGWELTTTRSVTGVPITSTRIDPDGVPVTREETFAALSSITASEALVGSNIVKTFAEAISDLVGWKVVETRAIFAKKTRSVGTPVVLPERFRSSSAINTKEDTVSGTVPDSVSLDTGEVERNEAAETTLTKRVRTTELNVEETPTLEGQEYDQQFDVVIPYVETIEAAGTSLGDNRKEIQPLSDALDLVKTVDPSELEVVFDTYVLSFPGTANLSLPNVLSTLSATIETNSGDGDTDTPYFLGFWSGHGSYSLPISGSSQASAAIIPSVIVNIDETWAHNVPTTHHMFFLPTPVTAAAVATKLAALLGVSVLPWPVFRPKSHTIVSVGQRMSLRVEANTHISDGGSDDSTEGALYTGNGASREVALVINTVHIPPTIHSEIGIAGTLVDSIDLTATTDSSLGLLTNYRTETGTVYGYVFSDDIYGDTLAATDGDDTIPTSGLRLLQTDCEPYGYGYARVHTEVVDFSFFA